MTYRHLLALALPLAVALPVSAAVVVGVDAKTEFSSAVHRLAHRPATRSRDYILSATALRPKSARNSATSRKLQDISRQTPPDPAMQQRLVNASSSCSWQPQALRRRLKRIAVRSCADLMGSGLAPVYSQARAQCSPRHSTQSTALSL